MCVFAHPIPAHFNPCAFATSKPTVCALSVCVWVVCHLLRPLQEFYMKFHALLQRVVPHKRFVMWNVRVPHTLALLWPFHGPPEATWWVTATSCPTALCTCATCHCVMRVTWQEAFVAEGTSFPNNTLVETWECWAVSSDLSRLTKRNQSLLSSACWFVSAAQLQLAT